MESGCHAGAVVSYCCSLPQRQCRINEGEEACALSFVQGGGAQQG